MKTANKVILLFKDGGGDEAFAAAISNALQPNPNTTNLRRLEEKFELSLEKFGIKDHKASGNIIHFLNSNEVYEVSLLLLENYDPPILACALNEVLASLVGENPPNVPTLVVPFLVEASKLKLENKNSLPSYEASLYGLQFGPVNTSTQALSSKIKKPQQSLQIHHEQLACLLHLVRILKIPAFVLVGEHARHSSRNTFKEDLEVIYEIGEQLANFSSLSFLREGIVWNPPKSSKISEEPWRALYG